MESFGGKNVLVTGGARGIGEAITRSFVSKGANVFVNYNLSAAQAKKLERELGCTIIKADVSNAVQVEKLKRGVLKKTGGKLDVLVNNAGNIHWVNSFEDITEKMWDELIDTNLKSVFLVTKAFAPALRKAKGSVVNLSSTGFFEGKFPGLHYSASKAGVVSLTKSFARQLGPVVRVNSVAPGFILTNFQTKYSAKKQEELLKGIALKRFGKSNEIAKVVVFLASSDASYVTGQTLVVDGGRIMIP